jgi:PPE-repeat protein
MGAVNPIVGARTSLNATGLATLASATYVASDAYDCQATDPADVLLEVALATTNTPTGNQQALVFVQASLDGTNFESGPTSGTTTTDEPDLSFVGVVPMRTATNTHRKIFSLAAALGYVPADFRVVIRNDLGVALTSGALFTSEVAISTT